MGWLEGAVRLFPGWEIRVFGHEIPELFFPASWCRGSCSRVMFLWPWIERDITRDRTEHNLLQYPRELPWRTAFGAATLTFFAVLTIAGGNDVMASFFGVSVEAMTGVLRVLVFVVPVVVLFVTYYVCRGLRAGGLQPVKRSTIMGCGAARTVGSTRPRRRAAGSRARRSASGRSRTPDASPVGTPEEVLRALADPDAVCRSPACSPARPRTAAALAKELGLRTDAVQRHLTRLARVGIVAVEADRRTYRLQKEGLARRRPPRPVPRATRACARRGR